LKASDGLTLNNTLHYSKSQNFATKCKNAVQPAFYSRVTPVQPRSPSETSRKGPSYNQTNSVPALKKNQLHCSNLSILWQSTDTGLLMYRVNAENAQLSSFLFLCQEVSNKDNAIMQMQFTV